MAIYSHVGINPEELDRSYEYQSDCGEIHTFTVKYNEVLVVNMPFIGADEKRANAQGWLRDSRYYFKEIINKNPEFFSEQNIEHISKGRAPYCDKVFINHFPEYEMYLGNKLIHHHVGRDGQSVAVPEDIHTGQGGVHLIEGKIGVDTNALEFSERVNFDIKNGKGFSWDNARDYIADYKEYQVKNLHEKTERIQETLKEYDDEYSVSKYPNTKERNNTLSKIFNSYNKLPSPVKEIIKACASIIVVETTKLVYKNVAGQFIKVLGGKSELGVGKFTETSEGGAPKSPHNRRGFSRALANGTNTWVKATRVHKELD